MLRSVHRMPSVSWRRARTTRSGSAFPPHAQNALSLRSISNSSIVHCNSNSGARVETVAQLPEPHGLAIRPYGNVVVSCAGSIWELNSNTLVPTRLAGTGVFGFKDGPAEDALFGFYTKATLLSDGSVVVADRCNDRIRKIDPVTNEVTTIAGGDQVGSTDGPGLDATFDEPMCIVADRNNNLYVAHAYGNQVRRIDAATSEVTTIQHSLDWIGPTHFFSTPGPSNRGLAIDNHGNLLITTQYDVVTMNPITQESKLLTDPYDRVLRFDFPKHAVVDGLGNIIALDSCFHIEMSRLKHVDMSTGTINVLAGPTDNPKFTTGAVVDGFRDGSAVEALFRHGQSIAVDCNGHVWIADQGNDRVRRLVDAEVAPISRIHTIPLMQRLEHATTNLELSVSKQRKWTNAQVRAAQVVEAASAELNALHDLIETGQFDSLNEHQVHDVLLNLGIKSNLDVLIEEKIKGEVLQDLTEADMSTLFSPQCFGDSRRSFLLIRHLVENREMIQPNGTHMDLWSVCEVSEYLKDAGYNSLVERFKAEGIDGLCLQSLNHDDLDTLGVATIGQKSKLCHDVARQQKIQN